MVRHAKHAAKKPSSGMHKMNGPMMPDKEMARMVPYVPRSPAKRGGSKKRKG